mmetsp:Transcript_20669/g.26672  ORF Transcript_20669/g.26672 Transcript_20669/m.26672 type:complete len:296 (+) Transcript_20669:174-1061(+)
MDPFGPKALITGSILATLLALRAVKKKSLTLAGATAGFAVGFVLVSTGLRGLTLFFFYQIGSWATKYKQTIKMKLDQTVATASVRGATQVLAVSVTAVVLSLYHVWRFGAEQELDFDKSFEASAVSAAILAQHAVSLGDTLASELGMATATPQKMVRLVLPPFSLVPPGTNGGVTVLGTIWSILGGCLCSLFTLAMDSLSGILPTDDVFAYMARVVFFGALCGGLGSLLDSILGASVQITYWDEERKLVRHDNGGGKCKQIAGLFPLLSNEGVNVVSVALTAAIGGWVLAPIVLS